MKTPCVVALAAAFLMSACASSLTTDRCAATPAVTGAPQPVQTVDSLDAIKAAFNAVADTPRVMLLVSPTCSECVFGAEVVRQSILDTLAARGVHAIVVWEPMLAPDNETAAHHSSGIFAGAPAMQFYDPQRFAGWAFEREQFSKKWDEVDAAIPADHWLRAGRDHKPEPAPEWDVYMLYKPGVRWESAAPKPDAFIRHIGRDRHGRSRFWRDRFNAPPATGDLHQAMEQMGRDVLGSAPAMKIELLGFPGCPNTPTMRENLRTALKSVGGGLAFNDVNQEKLPASDLRRGWPTPTILVNDRDLFDMPPPPPSPTPSMGCRVYPHGAASAGEIETQLRKRIAK